MNAATPVTCADNILKNFVFK